ncbi:MAG: Mrp/NBP35 family ATP-binding protein [Hyphomicrobiaceae bacterium]|nr:Mrp/NBP35 family ATP-binding protein [Hyphomicrobiaceae bacterium]
MSVSKTQVLDELRRIKGPDLNGNVVDLGLVSEILIKDARVYFSITVPAARAEELEPLRQAAQSIVAKLEGVEGASAVLTAEATPASRAAASGAPVPESARVKEARARAAGGNGAGATPERAPGARKLEGVPGVKKLIAVASGKGGVGKSTVAVNLALGLQARGLKVGILDADIFGPSQPRLLGLKGQPQILKGKTLKPMEGYGLKVMSMGFMVDEETPVIWRGPMVVGALNQMLRDVAWGQDGELDVLVIDMPPGTGDVQLTMAQQVPLSGAVIVSTPQDLALIDARKGLGMFRKVGVPVLGIVENMSYFECPHCGGRSEVFSGGGGQRLAEELEVPLLGQVPLQPGMTAEQDEGKLVVVGQPDSPAGKALAAIAKEVADRAGGRSISLPIVTG